MAIADGGSLTLQEGGNPENSLYLDTGYADAVIVDVNGEAVELDVNQAKQLVDHLQTWIGLVSA